MSSVEEFGQYLLLKKLSEDPLGEAFRAGRVGGAGMEQVVLLRIFNGRTINGPHLWQAVDGRQRVQKALRSPNLGEGVDLGEVRGIPYVAYEYISGKSLASLLVQASTENTPIPLDHALLIAERLALALSMAYEARVDGERLLHGFVVPHLVMVSNEGETRLLGFEVAPGLRDLAGGGAFGPEIGRYIAPELIAEGGARVDRCDDVWSLGVILYELLTCRPLPRPAADGGYGTMLDAAELPQEGGAIPPDVVALLKRSLAPRPQRIADAVNWHKAISKILIDGGHAATTFNLAFFMHNLFRAEIERESQEIEAEKTIEIPRQAIAAGLAAAAPAVAPAARPIEPASSARSAADDTASHRRGYGVEHAEASAGGGSGLWIGLAVAVLVALGGGAYFLYFQGRGAEPAPAEPVAAAPAEPAPPLVDAPPPEPEPAGPTPEDIQAQLTRMIEARSAEMEAKLRTQYDERIKGLQDQLEATQEASQRREVELREQQRLAAERRAAEARAAEQAEAEPETEEVADRPAGTSAPAAGAPPAGTAQAAGQQAAGSPAAGTPGLPPATATGAASSQPARPQVPAQTQAPAAAAESRVRVGDLVGFGPGVTPPDLIRMSDPIFPALAKRLNKSATVEVRVLVDEKGEVQQAEVAGKKAGFGFDQAAVDAARRASYRPATKDGVRVKMWTQLKVRFEP